MHLAGIYPPAPSPRCPPFVRHLLRRGNIYSTHSIESASGSLPVGFDSRQRATLSETWLCHRGIHLALPTWHPFLHPLAALQSTRTPSGTAFHLSFSLVLALADHTYVRRSHPVTVCQTEPRRYGSRCAIRRAPCCTTHYDGWVAPPYVLDAAKAACSR